MDAVKLILRTLLLPPASLLLLAFVGLAWRSRPRLGRALTLAALCTLWVLSTLVVAERLERAAQMYPALDPARLAATGAQAIVILGGGGQRAVAPEYGGGPEADPELLERLAYGAWLAHATSLPVLVTGWQVEARAMRATLARNFGIETRWVDANAYDTFENARDAHALLAAAGVHRVLLVSNAMHLRRAAAEFRATGLAVVPAPVHVTVPNANQGNGVPSDYLPSARGLRLSSAALHELIGEPVRELLAWSGLRRH